MEITLNVPEMKCTRCSATAPIQPRLFYSKTQIPEKFREALSSVVKEKTNTSAVDSLGQIWQILTDDKPAGWAKGPGEADLCVECAALWVDAGKAFMVLPPPPEVVEENAAEETEEIAAAVVGTDQAKVAKAIPTAAVAPKTIFGNNGSPQQATGMPILR